MTCRYCQTAADAYEQAAKIADGTPTSIRIEYGFVPSPNSRFLGHVYREVAILERKKGETHHETAHFAGEDS